MGYLEEKEEHEAKRREAHRRYMLTMSEVKDAEEQLVELQGRIPRLKEQAHKLRCRRDRLDKEWAARYSNDERNKKRIQLEKLETQIKQLKRELG